MACTVRSEPLVQKICELYDKISKLKSLSPSKDVDALFIELVTTCIPPNPIDVAKLCNKIKRIRNDLIRLCGHAEGLMEKHYSTILGSFQNPLDHLHLFPYYSNYLKLGRVEFDLLSRHSTDPKRVAFVGSGPLPLTSIVLASHHLKSSVFHNYDIDASANAMAVKLVESDPDLSQRMGFYTTDVMNLSGDVLREYDVVFLAALVGMEIEEKMRVVGHLVEHMAPGAILMLRSAHGARAFLYPVVDPRELRGFEVLSVYHPTDDVINSVVVARKCPEIIHSLVAVGDKPCSKCGDIYIQGFNNMGLGHMKMMDEIACQDHVC